MKNQILLEQLVNKIEKDISSNKKNKPFNKIIKDKTPVLKKISLITYSRNIVNIVNKSEKVNNNYKKQEENKTLNLSYQKMTKKNKTSLINDIKNSIIEYSNKKQKEKKYLNKNKSEKILKSPYQNLNEKYENYIKNKYNKYNTQELIYQIENEYSKIQFNNENDFIKRMENYTSKKILQEKKVNEILNKQKPKINEKKLVETFNRLIEDSNRRNEERIKKSKITSDDIIMNDIEENLKKSKSHKQIITKKYWDQIYEKRFKEKLNYYKNNLNKKKKECLLKNKIKEENELNEMKKYNKKVIMTQEQINKLNFRLYYKPISKRFISNISQLEKKNYNKETDLFNKSFRNNKTSKTFYSSKKMSKNNSKNNNLNTPSIEAEKLIDNFFYDK
jgi:hypothetical protein